MKQLKRGDSFAGIDIGSSSVSMTIKTLQKDKSMKEVEFLTMPVNLGDETFQSGKVNAETVETLCHILTGYMQVLRDYATSYVRAVATSAIGEAQNRDYILDQVYLRTGLRLTVIDDADEQLYMFKCLDEQLSCYRQLKKAGALLVYIGAGNVQLSIFDKSRLILGQTVKLGTTRIASLLSELQPREITFSSVMSEYIGAQLEEVTRYKQWGRIENMIVVSPESGLNQRITIDSDALVPPQQFQAVFDETMRSAAHGTVTLSLPALLITQKLLELSNAKALYMPDVRLCDGAVYDYLDKMGEKKRDIQYAYDMLWSARYIAKHHKCDELHSQYVETIALCVFDAIAQSQNLFSRHRLLLQTAAVLHECGKTISLNHYTDFSYSIILTRSLIGVSQLEIEMLAFIAKYMSLEHSPLQDPQYTKFPASERILCVKLIAILRLADALDVSRRQKIAACDAVLVDNDLKLFVSSADSLALEIWAFEPQKLFFHNTLGLLPHLVLEQKDGVVNV